MLILAFAILHFVISPSKGQVVTGGGCPSVTPKPNFDFRQYLGVWYEVEKYLFMPQITGNCVYVRYSDFQEENSTFIADIVQFEILSRKPVVSSCNGRISSADGSAAIDLKVPLPLPIPVTVRIDYPYYILDTDYVNYSIKWACREVLPGRNTQTMWILTRSRSYPSGLKDFIHKKLTDYGLNPGILVPSTIVNCPAILD